MIYSNLLRFVPSSRFRRDSGSKPEPERLNEAMNSMTFSKSIAEKNRALRRARRGLLDAPHTRDPEGIMAAHAEFEDAQAALAHEQQLLRREI
jgi:hypothetical protein